MYTYISYSQLTKHLYMYLYVGVIINKQKANKYIKHRIHFCNSLNLLSRKTIY